MDQCDADSGVRADLRVKLRDVGLVRSVEVLVPRDDCAAVQVTEVSQLQWFAVMGDNPTPTDAGCGADLPVMGVSWERAMQFAMRYGRAVRRLEKLDGASTRYSLPSEEQWRRYSEVAMADVVATPCAIGNIADLSFVGAYGRDGEESSVLPHANCDDRFATLAPVGTFRIPGVNVRDTYGNAPEWLRDPVPPSYGSYYGANYHLFVGGGFNDATTIEDYGSPNPGWDTYPYVGLRLVRAVPECGSSW